MGGKNKLHGTLECSCYTFKNTFGNYKCSFLSHFGCWSHRTYFQKTKGKFVLGSKNPLPRNCWNTRPLKTSAQTIKNRHANSWSLESYLLPLTFHEASLFPGLSIMKPKGTQGEVTWWPERNYVRLFPITSHLPFLSVRRWTMLRLSLLITSHAPPENSVLSYTYTSVLIPSSLPDFATNLRKIFLCHFIVYGMKQKNV